MAGVAGLTKNLFKSIGNALRNLPSEQVLISKLLAEVGLTKQVGERRSEKL